MTAAPARRTDGTGEPRLDPAAFRAIAGILREETGIHMPDSKQPLVEGRLGRRLAALGFADFEAFSDALAEAGPEGRLRLLEPLTTNTTRFEREAHHFGALRDEILPLLAERARRGGRIRLWSAACSSGEEAWGMALAVLHVLPEAASLDVRILATDISEAMLARARAGTYPAAALAHLPAPDRDRWFEPAGPGGQRRVTWPMAALVRVRPLNLMGDWPMRRPFDAILCRNVSIYFDGATQARLWSRLTDLLAPGGTLMIGHSERVTGPAERRLRLAGTTRYLKEEA